MDALIAKVDVPVPHVMYEKRVDSLVSSFESSLKQQGLTLEQYLQYTGMTMDSIRETYLERATGEVKLRLALEAIVKAENIEVTEAEIDDGLSEIAKAYNMELDQIKRLMPMDDYKMDLLVTKALDLVKENAVVDNSVAEKSED